MSNNVTNLPTCQGKKSDGSPCERVISPQAKYCYSHDSSRAEERKANAAKAGSWTKVGPELASLKKELRQLATDVRENRVTTGKGSVMNQILGMVLKVVEQERKQREQDQVVAELAELRELVDSRPTEGARASWR